VLYSAQNDNPKKAKQPKSKPCFEALSSNEKPILSVLQHTIDTIENQGKIPQLPTTNKSFQKKVQSFVLKDKFQELSYGLLHEIWACTPADTSAAMAMLLASLQTNDMPFLWITNRSLIQEHGLPYGPGLKAAGINPANLLLVRSKTHKETLWALEEGLKNKELSAVIGELNQLDLTASRRLALASRTHNTRCLLLMRTEKAASSAAYSRWQVAPTVSTSEPFDQYAPGNATLSAKLVKHRGGERPTLITMEWPHDTSDHIPVATTLVGQPVVNSSASNDPFRQRQITG